MKSALMAAVIGIASVAAAAAADMPNAAAPQAYPVVSPAYNWSGFYVGAMGGYGWSSTANTHFTGGFAGGTIGGNVQISSLVFGVEVEGAWSDIGRDATNLVLGLALTDRVEAFGSVTGRVGFAVDNVLIYGKGGFAVANNKFGLGIAGSPLGLATRTQTLKGYTVGGGVEYGFTPNWSAKAEYLFAHYGSENYFGLPLGDLDVHTVKFGINYRFGMPGPVVARY
jgi:outer membrane immunogenic protein